MQRIVIVQTTYNHGVIDFEYFHKSFEKIMHFMSRTSHSPKLVSFFAKSTYFLLCVTKSKSVNM